MSSGNDGLYLSPLSDMSPATSDCLEPYFSGGFSGGKCTETPKHYFAFGATTVMALTSKVVSNVEQEHL